MKKLIIVLSFLLTLTGCSSKPISDKQFCLDTIVQITLYEKGTTDILNHCFELCNEFELIFSPTNKNSELYKLNHSHNKTEFQTISDDLYQCIKEGLYYSELSNGAFDITLGKVTNLWDFKSDTPALPDEKELSQALETVGYENIILEENKIKFLNEETMIDLGAIAKGYIADQIKNYLNEQGVKSALINLGGNILCVGNKRGESFNIGLTDPKQTNQAILDIKGDNQSIVTSGIYQRNMTIDDKLYHHILNPQTGYSINNGLAAVTIISASSLDGDALSTICFALGKEKGIELIESLDDIEACFIDEDNQIAYSSNFEYYIK